MEMELEEIIDGHTIATSVALGLAYGSSIVDESCMLEDNEDKHFNDIEEEDDDKIHRESILDRRVSLIRRRNKGKLFEQWAYLRALGKNTADVDNAINAESLEKEIMYEVNNF